MTSKASESLDMKLAIFYVFLAQQRYTMIAEAVAPTKVHDSSGWLYGPFQSTKSIRTWLFNQLGITPHVDRAPDGRIIIKVGRSRIGEQVRGTGSYDGLVFVRSTSDALKA